MEETEIGTICNSQILAGPQKKEHMSSMVVIDPIYPTKFKPIKTLFSQLYL